MRGRIPSAASRLLTLAALVALVGGGGFLGYLIYSSVRQAVVHAQFGLPEAPPLVPVSLRAEQDEGKPEEDIGEKRQSPLAAALSQPEPERINILVMGVDVPDYEAEPARTDTIMVVSIDPTGGPNAVLSIPRDLWVPIGPYGENRINTAYFLGQTRSEYPGGGPGLLRATVEQNFGISIDYYVCVDFDGFRRLVDEIGGVTVEVERDIYDSAYPDGQGGLTTIFIPAGLQHMDGEMALQYARSRHDSNDFDRARRQQQLLVALRDEVLGNGGVTGLIPRLPSLYRSFSDAVETDLSLDDLARLADIAEQLDANRVETAVLDHTVTTRYITDRGWDVLLPIPEKIEPLIERLFRPPARSRQVVAEYELQASPQIVSEAAWVLVLNGSGRTGLAEAVAEYLGAQGLQVADAADLGRGDYSSTVVVVYVDKPATVATLISALRLDSGVVRNCFECPNPEKVDIKVILGQDFALPAD